MGCVPLISCLILIDWRLLVRGISSIMRIKDQVCGRQNAARKFTIMHIAHAYKKEQAYEPAGSNERSN